MAEDTKQSSPVLILGAWLIVSIPLAFGVYFTLLNSMHLFSAVPGH
jgi:hypothetical protein